MFSWEDIRVGDIVHLQEGREVPADVLLLYSEDDDFHVYADTKNLDGEVRARITNRPIVNNIQLCFKCPPASMIFQSWLKI